MPDQPFGIGFVSCGFITQEAHAPSVGYLPGVRITGLQNRTASTVEELADTLDRDRSNVNRSLSRLLDLDLAYRERRLLDPGGYVYQYTASPLPETKERLHEALDAWAEHVHERIDQFEDQRDELE
jgi:predicted transcriptional regulator